MHPTVNTNSQLMQDKLCFSTAAPIRAGAVHPCASSRAAYGRCQHVMLSQQSTVGSCVTACRQNGKVTGYVRIVVFSQNAAADVQHAIQELVTQVMCLL